MLQTGLSVEAKMQERKVRTRRVSTANFKPYMYHVRSPALRNFLADEFSLQALAPIQAACRFRCDFPVGYRGSTGTESRGGVESSWLAEREVLNSFTPLQLDCFFALSHKYRSQTPVELTAPPSRPHAPLSRRDAFACSSYALPSGRIPGKDASCRIKYHRWVASSSHRRPGLGGTDSQRARAAGATGGRLK